MKPNQCVHSVQQWTCILQLCSKSSKIYLFHRWQFVCYRERKRLREHLWCEKQIFWEWLLSWCPRDGEWHPMRQTKHILSLKRVASHWWSESDLWAPFLGIPTPCLRRYPSFQLYPKPSGSCLWSQRSRTLWSLQSLVFALLRPTC